MNFIFPQLEEEEILLQEDGAPYSFIDVIWAALNEAFPGCLMGRGGPVL
jgi:hypothetical protein